MEREKIKLRLAKAMQNSEYDLPTLANELGISLQRVQNYANGKALPTLAIFANICKILNISANKIIRDD